MSSTIWVVIEDDRGMGPSVERAFRSKAAAEKYAGQSGHLSEHAVTLHENMKDITEALKRARDVIFWAKEYQEFSEMFLSERDFEMHDGLGESHAELTLAIEKAEAALPEEFKTDE